MSDGDGNPRGYYHGGTTYPLWEFLTPTSTNYAMRIKSTSSSSPYGVLVRFDSATPNNTANYFLACTDASASRAIIYANGNIGNANNSYGAMSDQKLKENIVDSGSQWEDIKAIRVRKYSMKEDNLDAPNMLGVIAQELEASGMSGLVTETPDKDPNTNQNLGTTTKSVSYSIMYMKAIKALQEAMAKIEDLEARVKTLESQ